MTDKNPNNFINKPKENTPKFIKFLKGNLSGINLFLTDNYKKVCFPNEEYDRYIFDDMASHKKSNPIIFDVGGFMGVSSLLFSKTFGTKSKIISFEPNIFNLNRMRLNFTKNTLLSKNIKIYEIALGDKIGKANFFLSDNVDNGYSSTSRLDNTHVEHSKEYLESLGFTNQEINIDTLDNFVLKNNLVPNIIKVDIEGAEHLFLLGAKEFLKKYSPVLYIELHSQYCTLKCLEIMNCLGYKNKLLFEEKDNRIIVRFFKDNKYFLKTNAKIIDKITKTLAEDECILLKKKYHQLEKNHFLLKENINNLEAEKNFLIKRINSLVDELTFIKKNYFLKCIIDLIKIINKYPITKLN